MNMHLELISITCLVAVSCALPGVFLVLRGVALMSDAISHAILPGIVLMFLLVHNLASPLLMIGAVGAGLLTVFMTEQLIHTNRLKKDAAIGLVFPLFFSVGVILISQYARNVHLDMDMVLLGQLPFALFNRVTIYGIDCGPYALWTMSCIVLINIVFISLFYKELTLTTFDQTLAHLCNFSPILLYYGLMTITSITAIGGFDIVGAIVVVALMVTPAATAYLCTYQLRIMLYLSVLFGLLAAVGGCIMAHIFDVSIAGSAATMSGIIFLCALLCSPQQGILVHLYHARTQQVDLAATILETYLGTTDKNKTITVIAHDLGWSAEYTNKIIRRIKNRSSN